MNFKVFDRRDAVGGWVRVECSPLVVVRGDGRLLLSRSAWEFLALHVQARWGVALLFDEETRTAAVKPATEGLPEPARWAVRQTRSVEWPQMVPAAEFVTHYRIAAETFAVKLARGPGPRMLTFEVDRPGRVSSRRGVPAGISSQQ